MQVVELTVVVPGPDERLLDAVLRLTEVATHRVHLADQAGERRAVERVERCRVHRPTPLRPILTLMYAWRYQPVASERRLSTRTGTPPRCEPLPRRGGVPSCQALRHAAVGADARARREVFDVASATLAPMRSTPGGAVWLHNGEHRYPACMC